MVHNELSFDQGPDIPGQNAIAQNPNTKNACPKTPNT